MARTIEDRDIVENDAELIGEEMRQIEMSNEDFLNSSDWNELYRVYSELMNEAMYLTKVIEELTDV